MDVCNTKGQGVLEGNSSRHGMIEDLNLPPGRVGKRLCHCRVGLIQSYDPSLHCFVTLASDVGSGDKTAPGWDPSLSIRHQCTDQLPSPFVRFQSCLVSSCKWLDIFLKYPQVPALSASSARPLEVHPNWFSFPARMLPATTRERVGMRQSLRSATFQSAIPRQGQCI